MKRISRLKYYVWMETLDASNVFRTAPLHYSMAGSRLFYNYYFHVIGVSADQIMIIYRITANPYRWTTISRWPRPLTTLLPSLTDCPTPRRYLDSRTTITGFIPFLRTIKRAVMSTTPVDIKFRRRTTISACQDTVRLRSACTTTSMSTSWSPPNCKEPTRRCRPMSSSSKENHRRCEKVTITTTTIIIAAKRSFPAEKIDPVLQLGL